MPIAQNLIAVALPPAQAEVLGYSNLTPVSATGTSSGTAFALKQQITQIEVTSSINNTGIRLPSDAEFQQDYFILNSSATTTNVYPPTGGNLNGTTTDTPVTIGTNVTAIFTRIDRLRWVSQDNFSQPSGIVDSVSVATANGFAGSSSGGTTPTLTLSSTQSGTIYGNGTALSGLLGTTGTVLHGNAGGAPSFGQVALGSEVSGTLPIANGGWNASTAAAGRLNFQLLVYVADRTALAALDPTKDKVAELLEAGRRGTFVAVNASIPVSDPAQILYVASGTSGWYWSRVVTNTLYVTWSGAVGDGVTNDTTALQRFATLGSGWTLDWGSGLTFLINGTIAPPAAANSRWIGGISRPKFIAVAGSMSGPFIGGAGVTNLEVSGFEIDGTGSGTGDNSAGFGFTDSVNLRIRDCYIHNTYACGMTAFGYDRLYVQDNRFVSCGTIGLANNHGILAASLAAASPATNLWVTGNLVDAAVRKGITLYMLGDGVLSNAEIQGNTTINNGLGGIYVAADPAAVNKFQYINVSGNISHDNYTNISFDSAAGGSVNNNTLGDTLGGASLQSTGATDTQFGGNEITSPSAQAIAVTNGTRLQIIGNKIRGVTNYGIHPFNTVNSIIRGNDISSASGMAYGLAEDGGSDYNWYDGNSVAGATSAPSFISGTSSKETNTNNPSTGLIVTGPVYSVPRTLTGTSGSMVVTDTSLVINASGTFTLTLLAATSYAGRVLNLKSIAAQIVNSATSNVSPITSATPGTAIFTATAGKWAILQSDGTNWIVTAAN